jgi:dihydroorotase-like cyclic amidohydrolase
MLDVPWRELWRRMSDLPTRFMGLSHELAVDRPATFCLLTQNAGRRDADLRFFARGRECLTS